MKLITILEGIIKDRILWVNAKTGREIEVREENLVDTIRGAYERFGVPQDFVDHKRSTNEITNALLVRHWVSIKVLAGATLVHAATVEMARAALQGRVLQLPTKHMLVEIGSVDNTHKIELTGRDEIYAFLRDGETH